MYHGIYKFADVAVSISFHYKENAVRFESYKVTEKPIYEISLTNNRIKEELILLQSACPNLTFGEKEAEFNALYRDIPTLLWKERILLVHGVLIEKDGVGFLFSAPSGTGKSFHSKMWNEVFPSQVTIINGDKPLLRYTDNGVYGYGSPWMGKEGIGINRMVKLKAICRLSRGEKNVIHKIENDGQVISWLLEETMLKDRTTNIMELVRWYNQVIQHVSLYELKCNMDQDSVLVSYYGMCQ